ncbi:MAG: hypothetical protein IT306_19740 [Chloroflexi bacterium]|nr:hypothetical protein [Chloroflexota bacterium]
MSTADEPNVQIVDLPEPLLEVVFLPDEDRYCAVEHARRCIGGAFGKMVELEPKLRDLHDIMASAWQLLDDSDAEDWGARYAAAVAQAVEVRDAFDETPDQLRAIADAETEYLSAAEDLHMSSHNLELALPELDAICEAVADRRIADVAKPMGTLARMLGDKDLVGLILVDELLKPYEVYTVDESGNVYDSNGEFFIHDSELAPVGDDAATDEAGATPAGLPSSDPISEFDRAERGLMDRLHLAGGDWAAKREIEAQIGDLRRQRRKLEFESALGAAWSPYAGDRLLAAFSKKEGTPSESWGVELRRHQPTADGRRAVVYARWGKGKHTELVREDLARGRRHIEDQGLVLAGLYWDLDAPSGKRPAFQCLLQDAADGLFDVVLTDAYGTLWGHFGPSGELAEKVAHLPSIRIIDRS